MNIFLGSDLKSSGINRNSEYAERNKYSQEKSKKRDDEKYGRSLERNTKIMENYDYYRFFYEKNNLNLPDFTRNKNIIRFGFKNTQNMKERE